MGHTEELSIAAANKRSEQATRELAVAARSAKVKQELDDAQMDKKERRPLKEFTELRAELNEGVEEIEENFIPHSSMPPNILILRRKTIRQFPNNVMVALYYNDKLGQYFSIPYGGEASDDRAVITPVSLKESEEVVESMLRPRNWTAHNEAERWGDEFEKHVERLEPRHKGKVDMQYGHTLSSMLFGPEEAAKKYIRDHKHTLKEETLNEISLSTAKSAYEKRMADAHYNNARSTVSKDYFWRKEFSNRGAKSAAKGLNIKRLMVKKIERNDEKSRKESVKESLKEDAISHLQKVREFKTNEPLHHKDGSGSMIDPTTAHALLTVHGALHPDNQKKFSDALEHSHARMMRTIDFAWKQVR